jgi:tetratricopeptide (TPR) repeat protein
VSSDMGIMRLMQLVSTIALVTVVGLATGASGQTPAATPEDCTVLIRTSNALRAARGSGFIVGDGSWVVTASHVVSVDLGKGRRESDRTVLVYVPWTGRPYEAKVVALDGVADIALLRLPQSGFPALPVEGLDLKEATAAVTALQNRALRLYGFPLTWGEDTVAALAKPEHNESRLKEIAKRGETSLCVLNACPDVQPGWSGGPIVSEKGTVVAVFHSLYRPKDAGKTGFPSGSVCGYLGDLLKQAGATDLSPFSRPPLPTVNRPKDAGERLAHELRSLSWASGANLKKAEEEQRAILKAEATDVLARVELGKLLLAQKRYEEALKELEEAAKAAPKSLSALLYLGRARHFNFNPKGAEEALRAAMQASPGEVEPQLALADVFEDNQKSAEAEAVLRAAMAGAPTNPAVIHRLGSLLMANKKTEEGLKLLAQASELAAYDPSLSTIALAHARALDQNRKLREAETAYRQVIKLDPGNALAYFFLSSLYMRTGRYDDAQIQLNVALRLPELSDSLLEAFRALQVQINERGVGADK